MRVEVAQVASEHFAQRRGTENLERRAASVEPQRRDQRKESEDMVAVQMGDEYRPQFQRIDSVAEHLLLCALAGIDQVVLFVYLDDLRRRMSVGRRFGRGRA